ncbi:hypothetical protein DACRYDRAFT_12987 [Dacryopinax primogenitus]|uniref:Uncharacterized protein n=1 Tax=Dacryopinax primogenitus (strain DJM 731) TaxID=1858805 RepID=M5GFG7_DACPD|nr:uncharacterized protein DACRYDRAFT_12987 [Dacryopinax primogenitus]EJU06272.1 hypothetical protein DACRYDRAFT_12987 [Dacryopinax primogenitus]
MPPQLAISTAPSSLPSTNGSGAGRGKSYYRGRRGARGVNSASASDTGSATESSGPSLLSRIGPRTDGTVEAASPTTPRAEGRGKSALSIRGTGLPPKPVHGSGNATGNGKRGSGARKVPSSISLSASSVSSVEVIRDPPPHSVADPPPMLSSANSSKDRRVAQSAPPERPVFDNVESDRPASALVVSATKEASLRSVSPTPRLNWADETDDDSLPDLDDWMTPALTAGLGYKDETAPGEEDDHATPVATNAPAGPLRERRKRGAGKKNKQLAAKAAENAAAAAAAATSDATPGGTANAQDPPASGLDESITNLSLGVSGKEEENKGNKVKPKEKETEVTTPKADWRSVLPDTGRDGALQLLSALAGSISTSKPAYRTPAQRHAEAAVTVVSSATLDPPVISAPEPSKPATVSAGPSTRVRAVPSPAPIGGVSSRGGPQSFPSRVSPRVNGVHHSTVSGGGFRGPYRAEPGDTPVTLPKKHARPVITADAITRLARGLMATPKHDHSGAGNGGGSMNGSEGGSTAGDGDNDAKENKADSVVS